MARKIRLKKLTKNQYEVYFQTVFLGWFTRDVDGYFYFWLDDKKDGSWAAYSLRWIADALDKVNKKWNDKVNLIASSPAS